jgi:hypothetical protein
MLWCWRCKAEMPMLDEQEFAEALRLHSDVTQAIKRYRERHGVELKAVPAGEYYQPILNYYERVTGVKERNPNAVMHHRLSLYGPACRHCGKPLRTPKAKLCGGCMRPVAE